METIITFTPAQLIASIVAICGAITAVTAVVNIVSRGVQKAQEPHQRHEERIKALEADVADIKGWLGNDKKAIEDIEEGNRVTQTAILALLSHAIDGNNVDELKTAKNGLNEYLIRK